MKIGIIGAGASGMMAAITATQLGAEVTLFEKKDRVGKKILATGNGKCNIGNLDFDMNQYYCKDKVKLQQIFSVHSVWDTISFFESAGMLIRNKNGYLYPYSEQASTVLDVLRKLIAQNRIEVVTESEISNVRFLKDKKCFLVENGKEERMFDKVILSCGSPASLKKGEGMNSYQIAKAFGHHIVPVVPALVQLKVKEEFLKGMAGVRTQAHIVLMANNKKIAEEQGELQFTEYGISGIPVFQLSRLASYALQEGKDVQVKINLLPDYEEGTMRYIIRNRYENQMEETLEEFLLGVANKKINMAMIKKDGLKPNKKVAEIGFEKIKQLLHGYRSLILHIKETNGIENAQVCAGGVDFAEVNTELESAKQPGLYLTGEMLDVDGRCGGYNLQWAWTSGFVAGRNAAGKSTKELICHKEEENQNA